jgi:hypothetical protein
MTLATKNGSLIVKDGQIAENCGCCGGWYCYTCEFQSVVPDSVVVTLSSSSSDAYAYGKTVESQDGENAISHTSFMFGAIGGEYMLLPSGTNGSFRSYSYSDDKLSLSLSLNTDGRYEQYVWELFFEAATIRRVEEYGPGGNVRSQSTMASANWNSGTTAGAFRSSSFGNPFFWRSPGAISDTTSGYRFAPNVTIRQKCDCRQSANAATLGWRNNSQSVYLSGQQCGTDLLTGISGSACDISLSAQVFPLSGTFKRFDVLATSYDGLAWPPQLQQMNAFNFSSDCFVLNYTIQSVSLVSGSQTVPLPLSLP